MPKMSAVVWGKNRYTIPAMSQCNCRTWRQSLALCKAKVVQLHYQLRIFSVIYVAQQHRAAAERPVRHAPFVHKRECVNAPRANSPAFQMWQDPAHARDKFEGLGFRVYGSGHVSLHCAAAQ